MRKTIEWCQDITGKEPELFERDQHSSVPPISATTDRPGQLVPGELRWNYRKGEKTVVEVIKHDKEAYDLLDVRRGHQISVPEIAFRFVN